MNGWEFLTSIGMMAFLGFLVWILARYNEKTEQADEKDEEFLPIWKKETTTIHMEGTTGEMK